MDSVERKQKKQRDILRMYAISKCEPSKEAVEAFQRKPFQDKKVQLINVNSEMKKILIYFSS